MRLLIADLLRRDRWKTADLLSLLLLMQGMSAALGDPDPVIYASMGVPFALGPLALWHLPRSIWYPPVAKRDIWRAQWLVATVGVTLFTTAVKLAALLVPQVRESFGFGSAVLSSIYGFAYAGVGCGLVILATQPQRANGKWRVLHGLPKGLAEMALPLAPSVTMLGIFATGNGWIHNILPVHWTDLTARSAAMLLAALGVTVATYFHSPVPLTPANRIPARSRARARAARVEPGGLSGLPRLLLHESAWSLKTGGAIVAGSAIFVLVAARITEAPDGVIGFLRSALLRMDGHVAPEPATGIETFILLIGFALFVASLMARFPAMIRHLRVLPVGTARLHALLVLWPAAIWLVAWTAWLSLHSLVVGPDVPSYRLDVLLGAIGASAIVQALTLRFAGYVRVVVFVCSMFGLAPGFVFADAPPHATFAAIGLALIAGAVMLNVHSLARKSTYDAVGLLFGVLPTQNWK